MKAKRTLHGQVIDEVEILTKPSHTPTPWHLHDMEQGIICTNGGLGIIDCNAGGLYQPERKANAAFIVRAVNAHEELLEALREIAKGAGPFSRDPHEHATDTIEAMKDLAIQAIAKAEGGK